MYDDAHNWIARKERLEQLSRPRSLSTSARPASAAGTKQAARSASSARNLTPSGDRRLSKPKPTG